MSGRRIYELAKELGVPNKDLVERAKALGMEVRSHSSTVSASDEGRLRAEFQTPAPAAEPASAAAEPEQPAGTEPVAAEPSDVVRSEQPQRKAPTRPPAKPEAPTRPEAPPVTPGQPPAAETEPAPASGPVALTRGVTLKEFAERIDVNATDVIKALMRLGSMKTITQSMTDDEIELVASEFGVEVQVIDPAAQEALEAATPPATQPAAAAEPEFEPEPRPAVVTVMGHVDHGKTTVLDRIREADVAASEHGGITQHIGAYQVEKDGNRITFIDTPGHEAFTAMRARGAQVTDLAILVVAADDGVMPQTLEAIDHARAAEVPIVVAVNKVDKDESDPTRVRTQLAEVGLQPQEWGGDTIFVDMSAKENLGIDELLTAVGLVADDLELTAPAQGPARGVVLEAHLDRGRGPLATVLVRRGTLEIGDAVVAGAAWGKVRGMVDEYGRKVKQATPARPVLVLGWNSVPQAGDEVHVVADEKSARSRAQERDAARRAAEAIAQKRPVSLEQLFSHADADLNLIVKADVQGSVEALADALSKLDVGDVRLNILSKGVGPPTLNDLTLAQASRAVVVAFNVRPEPKVREAAEAEGIEIRSYRVIYEAIEEIEKALKGLLAPEFREVVLGTAEIREVFKIPRGVVAGCYITHGTVRRNASARLLRDGTVLYEGKIASLRRFKDDVREVQQGFECGIGLEGYTDVRVGDTIDVYEEREVPRG